jgi:predicted CXXCH cytochrome family protein
LRIVWTISAWFLLLLLLLAPAMAGSQDPFAEGEKLFKAGHYAAALKPLQQAFRLRPDNLMTSYYLGRAAFETGDNEAAIVAFERIQLRIPDAAEINLQLARVHARSGAQTIAWAYFSSLRIPDLPTAAARQAKQYAESNNRAEQGKLLESLLAAAASHEGKVRPFAETAKSLAAAATAKAGTRAPAKGESAPDAVGFVAVVRGNVKATHPRHGERILKVKSELFKGDTVVTARGEGAQIVFNDNTVVRLGASSTYAIDAYAWDAEKNRGEMRATVKEGVFSVMGGLITKGSPEKFIMDTPAATIGVRGSMFTGSYLDGQLNLVFLAGTGIYLAQGEQQTEISQPGYGVQGVFGGAFGAPREIGTDVLGGILQGLQPSPGDPAKGPGEQSFDTIHQKSFACFDDPELTFKDDPFTCQTVCSTCHSSDVKSTTAGEPEPHTLVYTLTFCEDVAALTAAELTVSGGKLVDGSLTQVSATQWTLRVTTTGSTAELVLKVNDDRCVTITRKGQTDKIVERQIHNPELLWNDMVYPGLYPGAGISDGGALSSSNSYEQNWALLPAHHQACRECHPDQSIDAHNHPIFVFMAVDYGNGLVEEKGLILCTSCHDPHSNESALLRLENSGSKLCQYCHSK